MKIFISYRRADSGREVGRIRDRLMAAFGEDSTFRDLVDIPAGKDFRTVLEEETNSCNVTLVVIGPQWASITGQGGNKRLFDPVDFTRIEVETGLRRLATEESIVIPVLVQNAMMPSSSDIPESIASLTYQNAISIHDDPYFDFDMDRLIDAIKGSKVYAKMGFATKPFEPETIYISKGPFWMGSEPGEGIPIYETPRHEVSLSAFRISKYAVTNSQYHEFVLQGGPVNSEMNWEGRNVRYGFEDKPVTGVSLDDAQKYCEWLSGATGRKYTIPNEAQLEKAYQTPDGCSYMADHVYQWTCTLWGAKGSAPDPRYRYPWQENDGRNNLNANSQIRRVVCVYPKQDDTDSPRVRKRSGQFPRDVGFSGERHGFRVVTTVS